jgi:hypothetical protein
MKSFSSLLSRFTYGRRLKPYRDWFVLITLFFVCLIGSFVWNLWLFSKVTNGQAIGNTPPEPPQHAVNLDGVKAMFDARAAERTRYENQYRFVDPSV